MVGRCVNGVSVPLITPQPTDLLGVFRGGSVGLSLSSGSPMSISVALRFDELLVAFVSRRGHTLRWAVYALVELPPLLFHIPHSQLSRDAISLG